MRRRKMHVVASILVVGLIVCGALVYALWVISSKHPR